MKKRFKNFRHEKIMNVKHLFLRMSDNLNHSQVQDKMSVNEFIYINLI